MEKLNQYSKFYGDENNKPIELLKQREKTIDPIRNQLTYQDKINVVAKYC